MQTLKIYLYNINVTDNKKITHKKHGLSQYTDIWFCAFCGLFSFFAFMRFSCVCACYSRGFLIYCSKIRPSAAFHLKKTAKSLFSAEKFFPLYPCESQSRTEIKSEKIRVRIWDSMGCLIILQHYSCEQQDLTFSLQQCSYA